MSNDEYFSPEEPYAPPRQNSGCMVAGLIAGIVGITGVLAIACCGGLAFFGMGVVAQQVADDLQDNPVVEEHLGAISSIETNWTRSAAAGEDEFVYDVEGPKGKGRLRVVSITRGDDTEEVVSGTLEMADGERYDLFPDEDLPADEPLAD